MSGWRTLDGAPARVIAHRGASGPLPEHTLPAYALAHAQGADVLEPDLVISRDGHLIVRHDRGLARSTDVAHHTAFASRREGEDWPIDRFDRDELHALRAVQPFPDRDRSHDSRHELLDFGQLLRWAEDHARREGRPIVLYPELKHPAAFAQAGLDPVPRFVEQVRDLDPALVRIWVQCFELEPLRRVRDATGLPVHLLLDADADWRTIVRDGGRALDGLGASKALLTASTGRDSGLVEAAHAAGLAVHAWTYRDDRLPPGFASVEQELELAFALGVDAVFCDFPQTGLACRANFVRGEGG